MNFRLPAVIAAIGCVLFASCSPYNENQDKKATKTKQEQKTISSPDQQKIKKQRDEMKEKQAASTTELPTTSDTTKPETSTETTTTIKPAEEKRPEWKFANKVPGKDGYVFSPYNNKVVDVKGIPSGTLVQDPTYTGEGKGYFRVP